MTSAADSYDDRNSLFDRRSSNESSRQRIVVYPTITDNQPRHNRPVERITVAGILSSITVEPALLLYTFAYMMYSPVYSFMFMDKLCLQYCGYSTDECNAFGTGKNATIDTNVQKIWAQFDNYSTIISTIPQIIFALFMGPWSDVFGRKLPMMMPFMGTMLAVACAILLYFIPGLPVWMLFLPSLSQSLFGGITSLLTGAFSYAADVSHEGSSRTIRIALIEICLAIGFALAGVVSGTIIGKGAKYYVCYSASLAAAVVGFLYIMVRIRDTRRPDRLHTIYQTMSRLFTVQNLVASYETMTRKRTGRARRNLWLLFVALFFFMAVFMAEININQKFFMGAPLHWSLSFYITYNACLTFIGMVVVGIFIAVTKKVLNWRDTSIGIVGCLSRMAHAYIIAIATATWMVYLASSFGLLKFVTIISIRSLMSKLVPKDEQGKIFSLIATCEAVSPLIGSPIVTAIFTATAQSWPAFFSLVAAYATLIPLAVLVLVDYYMRCDESKHANEIARDVSCDDAVE